jgi:hypothetical protein
MITTKAPKPRVISTMRTQRFTKLVLTEKLSSKQERAGYPLGLLR